MVLRNTAKHTVEVYSPAEAKDALEAADTLDLTLRHAEVRGRWTYEVDTDITRHAECGIENIGRKWFYLGVTGETIKCRPRPAHPDIDHLCAGHLRLKFD